MVRKLKFEPNYNFEIYQALVLPLNDEIATQAWYRFLRLISNPVELTDPGKIARKTKFVQMAKLTRGKDEMLNTINHPCLQALPGIFLRTMQERVIFFIFTGLKN